MSDAELLVVLNGALPGFAWQVGLNGPNRHAAEGAFGVSELHAEFDGAVWEVFLGDGFGECAIGPEDLPEGVAVGSAEHLRLACAGFLLTLERATIQLSNFLEQRLGRPLKGSTP